MNDCFHIYCDVVRIQGAVGQAFESIQVDKLGEKCGHHFTKVLHGALGQLTKVDKLGIFGFSSLGIFNCNCDDLGQIFTRSI